MDYLKEFLVLLALGGLGGVVLAWGNNRLFMPRQAESMRALVYISFIIVGLGLAGVAGIERAYKGLFDEMTMEIYGTVNVGLMVVGLDPQHIPVGEAGRVLEEMDRALHRAIERNEADWFIEFLEPWSFSEHLERTRAFARLLRRVDIISIDQVFLLARDASFVYLFPWAGPATWAVLLLFPFLAWLLRVSAR